MDTDVTFGQWFKRRRRLLDMTQGELAQQVGCAVITIRKIEGNELRPSKDLAQRLAVCLALRPDEFAPFIAFARGKPYFDQISPPAIAMASLPQSSGLEQMKREDWAVAGLSTASFVTQHKPAEDPTVSFVAREQELNELAEALAVARADQGQIRFVIGGAGRGKTTLIQEFARRAQVSDPELLAVSGHCNAHIGIGAPYLPFREALTRLMGDVEAKWLGTPTDWSDAQRLWAAMPRTIPALVKDAPDLIGSFIPAPALQARAATFAGKNMVWFKQLMALTTGNRQTKLDQQSLFIQYITVLKTIAAQQPLLLILENLHWIDAASSSLLFHLSRQVTNSHLLIIGTYRSDEVVVRGHDEQHPLASLTSELKRQYGDIWLDLGNLAPAEGRRFVEAHLDTQPNRFSEAFRQKFYQQTRGHPLFTVELLREMQARGDLYQDQAGYWLEDDSIDWQTLPAKIEGVIEKRTNRLPEELRTLLTVASVEGEWFTGEVVAQVQQMDEWRLARLLNQELDKQHRLITAQQATKWSTEHPSSRYRFRHYLFQQYLYHNLTEMERVYLHRAVGQALESLYEGQTEQVALQLARHFELAGLTQKAVAYLLQGGQTAVQLSANDEAIPHLTKGLALLEGQPDTSKRARQELNLRMGLGMALVAIKGYAAPEVKHTYTQARILAHQLGDTAALFESLGGLSHYYRTRGALQQAREEAKARLNLARQLNAANQSPLLLKEAHYTLGHSLVLIGELNAARAHLEQGLAINGHRGDQPARGHFWDYETYCPAILAQVLWLLGYPEQALAQSRAALRRAQNFSYLLAGVYIMNDAAELRLFCEEGGAVQRQIDKATKLARKQGFTQMLTWTTYLQGRVLVAQGQPEQGIIYQRQGIAALRAIGGRARLTRYLATLANAHKMAGQVEEGLSLLTEALALVDKHGEHFWEAEIFRLQGELLLQAEEKGGSEEMSPEACFLKAIDIARSQNAKSLELRAVMSLSRLWQRQGKSEAARHMLAEIYNWFSEGFATSDLKMAKTLLETLSQEKKPGFPNCAT